MKYFRLSNLLLYTLVSYTVEGLEQDALYAPVVFTHLPRQASSPGGEIGNLARAQMIDSSQL